MPITQHPHTESDAIHSAFTQHPHRIHTQRLVMPSTQHPHSIHTAFSDAIHSASTRNVEWCHPRYKWISRREIIGKIYKTKFRHLRCSKKQSPPVWESGTSFLNVTMDKKSLLCVLIRRLRIPRVLPGRRTRSNIRCGQNGRRIRRRYDTRIVCWILLRIRVLRFASWENSAFFMECFSHYSGQ